MAHSLRPLTMKSPAQAIQLAGERRQVTALFYDVVGSTELLQRSDPEEFSRLLADFHRVSEKIIQRHGGLLHQKLGDGGCSYFGYPEQAEDAAEKAVRASLDLIDGSVRLQKAQHHPFKIRVGVATSLVVISSDGSGIIGTAPVVAARLQAEAEPNSVVVADSTYLLTRNRFDYHFLRGAHLKGFADPMPIWRPLSTIATAQRFSPNPEQRTPMRGRDEELGKLRAAWRAAREGKGRSMVVLGDAGIGKSRLVSELRRQLQPENDSAFALQCHARLTSQPLHPFIGFLETTLGTLALQSRDGSALRKALRQAGIAVDANAATVIADFVGEQRRATSGSIWLADMSGQQRRKEVIDAAAQLLCSRASKGPLLVAVEDVHWADNMTLELLDVLTAHVRELPMLLVQTSRSAVSGTGRETLTLSGLDHTAMSHLVASIWGEAPPPDLTSFVLQKCDGMPLYAEELTLFMRTRHALAQGSSSWTKLLSESGVSTLNDLLSARLADVGHARRIAQLASVIGREFSAALLRDLLDGIDVSTLETDLNALTSSRVIERKETNGDIYRFRHALLHEAAYGSLLKSDRRDIHKRIGRLLIEEDVPSLPASVAAWQCAQGGMHVEAVRFALSAGEACVLHSAMQEADQLLELATEQIDAMPRQPARTVLLLDLLQLQGVVSVSLEGEGSEKARKIYARAVSLMRRQPVANRAERFSLYWGWWFTASNIRTQQSRAHLLVDEMRSAEDVETRLQSYHCAWATSFQAAQHDFCLDCVARGLALYDPDRAIRDRAFYGGHDAKVCGLGERALCNLLTGEHASSEVAISQCLEWAAATDHVGSIVHALHYTIVLRRCQGRYHDVASLAERMRSISEQHGLAASLARADIYGGWAEAMSSSLERGANQFESGLDLQQKIGTGDNMSIHIDMQSEILQRSGRPAEASALVDKAILLGRKEGQWFWLSELYRRRAQLRQVLGDKPQRVVSDLRRAIQTAESQGAKWLAVRAEDDLRLHGG
ncbi:ATP-binding protein [Mesorhizobium sp. RSR380A]|uniref:ATP-binding protein n=1 Tax=Mesorhizobium sp. LNJC380A00 TaxID=1287264 RepID=UPI0003FF7D03|nr:AAA family ATPase [Mesorhizobium sp. LNJC380A00]